MRVLIADDHSGIRAGVRAALEGQGCEICAEAVDAESAVAAAERVKPDVCLLDVHMPGSGITAAERITATVPDTVVVMLTVSHDDSDLFAALRAGATGYLLKDIEPDRLAAALEGARRGEAPLPAKLVTRLVEEFQRRERRTRLVGRRGVRLTERESEVLDLLARDYTTAEIAQHLIVSPATVRGHVSALLKRLHVPDRESARRLVRGED